MSNISTTNTNTSTLSSTLSPPPPLRWGIVGCGRVSHDFVQALKHLPPPSTSSTSSSSLPSYSHVVACAARSEDRAKEFAERHGIDTWYGTYEELWKDERVDIVYVGIIHMVRRSIGEQCLMANKHVLLEKPFCLNLEDAQYLINLARHRNLFLMEGMWTRFFPAVEEARRLIHEERLLGDVLSVTSDFHFQASDSDEYPTSFLYQHALGGGATFLVAPYPLAMVTAFFPSSSSSSSSNNNNPNKDNSDSSVENVTTTTTTKIHAVGQVDSATGVDLQVAAVVSFTPTSPANATTANSTSATPVVPGAGLAMITYGMLGESNEETIVIGTKGRLTIRNPCHCPTRLTIRLKGDGRGQATQEYDLHFPLPDETPEIIEAGGFVYPNSAGFVYEAAAVMRCIASGQVEAPQYTWSDTLWNMARMDEIRWQLGVQPLREQEDDDEEEEN